MISTFLADQPFVRDAAWQTTLLLLLGVIGSLLWARRPARAHRFLVFMMAAALLTPLLSQSVRSLEWGLFGGLAHVVAGVWILLRHGVTRVRVLRGERRGGGERDEGEQHPHGPITVTPSLSSPPHWRGERPPH